MIKRLKVDELLLFFLSAIFFIVLGFKDAIYNPGTKNTGLIKYFRFENNVNFPKQGFTKFSSVISLYNPDLELWCSTNGGETFSLNKAPIELQTIRNSNLTIIPNSYHWRAPDGFNDECKSIVCYVNNKKDNSRSERKVLTYFSNNDTKIPKLCLTLPESDLVDYDYGIMILGNDANYGKGFYTNWWDRNANYKRRGVEAEKEAFLQFFENNELKFEQTCGLKISGNATRAFPQKSMQLVAHQKYGDEIFKFSFFGDKGFDKYSSLVIRNSGNDNTKTLFADLLMQNLAEESNVLTQKGRPVSVYLNGNYWGIYNLRERVSVDLISDYEKVKNKDITLLEGGEAKLKDGGDKEKKGFDSLISKINEADKIDDLLFNEISTLIDMTSFMDYIIFETYYGNSDWPTNNVLFYKVKNGKWKWILQDLDYGLAYAGTDAVNINLFNKLKAADGVMSVLFNKLIVVDEFKSLFTIRANEILENNLSNHNVNLIWKSWYDIYVQEIVKHNQRWRVFYSIESWKKNCDQNLKFLHNRNEIYIQQIGQL